MVCNLKFNSPQHSYKIITGETEGKGRGSIQKLSALSAELFYKPKIKSTDEYIKFSNTVK